MRKLLQYTLPFQLPQKFQDEATYRLYKKWEKPARQVQIFAITLLTALLYIILNFFDKSWASEQTQLVMLKRNVFLLVPILLTISFLAYKKRFYQIVMPALAFFPVIGSSSLMYIASQLQNPALFLPEGYLGVFWIFIVSGMTFRYALISASISSLILLVAGLYIINDPDIYAIHAFWIFCSFSFGFLGGLMFDRSKKAIFITQQDLHHLAVTDELTGIFNRNQLNNALDEEISRSLRYQKTFGLLILDIDHFKNINDTFGHLEGDNVLRKVAQLLGTLIRSNDTIVRWGGEEFVVVVVEVDEKTLNNICENLLKRIEDNNYHPVEKVTVSIGATLFKNDDSQDVMLKRADKALYQAKEKGRNRVTLS